METGRPDAYPNEKSGDCGKALGYLRKAARLPICYLFPANNSRLPSPISTSSAASARNLIAYTCIAFMALRSADGQHQESSYRSSDNIMTRPARDLAEPEPETESTTDDRNTVVIPALRHQYSLQSAIHLKIDMRRIGAIADAVSRYLEPATNRLIP